MYQEGNVQEDDETQGKYLKVDGQRRLEGRGYGKRNSYEKTVCNMIHAQVIGSMHLLIRCSHEHCATESCQCSRTDAPITRRTLLEPEAVGGMRRVRRRRMAGFTSNLRMAANTVISGCCLNRLGRPVIQSKLRLSAQLRQPSMHSRRGRVSAESKT